jgi:Zn-dependent peptidase ImmA (M78 family)
VKFVRRNHIRKLVDDILEINEFQSMTPVPIEKIIENYGIILKKEPADDSLSGFILTDMSSKNVIIGVNSSQHSLRQRFSMAHELGHFLLHENESIHFDYKSKILLRDETSSKGTDVREKEANLFAAELLMPTKFLKQDFKEIDSIDFLEETEINLENLARKYEVSAQAMTFRLAYLGYLNYQW